MRFSVVIPAYNEASSIGALLESICAASYGSHALAEAMVYDDGSTDGTATTVSGLIERFAAIRMIRGERRMGCATAVETLLREAANEAIVKINADIAPDAGALEHLVDALDAGAACAVGAANPIVSRASMVSLASAFSFETVERLKRGPHLYRYATGHLVAYRRSVLGDLNFPAALINDDRYTAEQIARSGGRFAYVPAARYRVKTAANALDYWRISRRVLEGERQLERIGITRAPLSSVLSAVAVTALRRPLRALPWAALYIWSSLRSSPTRDSRWPIATSTKGAF
ncbi:MAG: glycosyltransferase [Candidatus Eremiobacteraeota bacterium]|nr:glycosyltransferase [Candidatus Eremiobacteraeota bacterium]